MRNFSILLFISVPFLTYSQSAEDDEIAFRSALDWLDRKLNYYYYDDIAQKWWLNKFYVNERKEVTIKNISTDKPQSANIKEKVYLIRKFTIQDINPYQIRISDISKSQGRIAKGKLLELRTYTNQKKITKTVDGRKATTTSFVHISFPSFMTDSIADYAERVQSKLKEAILASTRIYASGDVLQDKKQIFEMAEGAFESSAGGNLILQKEFENVFSLQMDDRSRRYFGYDPGKQTFYILTVSSDGALIENYRLLTNEKLVLQSFTQESNTIEFETLHSIRFNGTNYRRK